MTTTVRPARVAIPLLLAAMLGAQPAAVPQAAQESPQIIRGRVMSADATPRPLPNARIAVLGSDEEPVFTTGQGEFALRASVSSSLRITKAGFAPAVVRVSAAAAGDLPVSLLRGAVVTGLVVDELGFPVSDARVHVRWAGPADTAPGATDFFAETDDAGQYRVGSLAPGRYTVNSEPLMRMPDMGIPGLQGEREVRLREELQRAAAQARPLSDLVRVELAAGQEVTVVLAHRRRSVTPPDAPIAGAIAGTVLDEFAEPVEGASVRLWLVRFSGDRSVAEPGLVEARTDDRGQYRLSYVRPGRYLVAVSDGQDAFAPVYFPGTTVAANAVPVTLGRKEEAAGVNVTFTRTREARVAGVALDARGGPLRGSVTLVARRRSGSVALVPRTATTDEAGAFEFRNIPPGDYVLQAATPPAGSMRIQTLEAFGAQFLTVSGPDPAPVTIIASPTATVSGRFVVEGAPEGFVPRAFFVSALPDADAGPVGRWGYEGRVEPDGTFRVPGLAGTLRLSVGTPPGWWVKSILVGGVDALHEPIRFDGPDTSRTDVTVLVSPGTATVAGRVTDDAERPVEGYRVVVFSTDPLRWFGRSPYVRLTAGPEGDGGFRVRDLPPGDYWAVALDTIEGDADAGEWQNPDVLARLANLATRITVNPGGRASSTLRLVRWE